MRQMGPSNSAWQKSYNYKKKNDIKMKTILAVWLFFACYLVNDFGANKQAAAPALLNCEKGQSTFKQNHL